jgi:hypothetical protein
MTQRHKLIALPKGPSLHLTPKLWVAVGLIAYNHHLMTLEPLEVLNPHFAQEGTPLQRATALRQGLAAMLSTEGLTRVTRTAVVEIARALLAPLGLLISTHGGKRVPGIGHTAHYILVEDLEPDPHHAIPDLLPKQPEPIAEATA